MEGLQDHRIDRGVVRFVGTHFIARSAFRIRLDIHGKHKNGSTVQRDIQKLQRTRGELERELRIGGRTRARDSWTPEIEPISVIKRKRVYCKQDRIKGT